MTSAASNIDPAVTELIEESRARALRPAARRSLVVALCFAAAFLAAAAAFAAVVDTGRMASPLTIVALVAGYALASRVAFEVSTGWALPTELVLVPMVFLVPPDLVPFLVAVGLVLGSGRAIASLEQVAVRVAGSWHALAPATAFALVEPAPTWQAFGVLLLALPAQFALDFASAAGMDRVARGLPALPQLRFMATAYGVDAALAPIGFAIAVASFALDEAFLLALPLLGLLAVFARERTARVDAALELSSAYRGTAFLLGDVIEADDAYTGSHSRDVVSLSLAVAEELRLDARTQRRVELAALLHDVGKIRVPNEIINKAGPLDDDEWALMKQHTVEGQRMLERVGGLLGEVGAIVRSCHERWDGGGYPDGLAGEAIPIEARIVCACDAFDAMTTDRSYRRAMSVADARAELERCAATHFDPAVVRALLAVS